jgi:predicted transglutaminase-like cysteine proteinase
VLLVKTDHGTLVLDSRRPHPVRWTDLEQEGYVWLAVERRDGTLLWRLTRAALQRALEPPAAAAK